MNPFVALLALVVIVGWIVGALALIVGSLGALASEHGKDRVMDFLAGLAFLTGLAMLLGFLAVATGGIQFADRPDGCYYVHRQLVGKTIVTKYDPIECVGVDVR